MSSSPSTAGHHVKETTEVPIRALRTTVAGTLRFADRIDGTIAPARKAEPATRDGFSLAEDGLDVLDVPALEVPLGV